MRIALILNGSPPTTTDLQTLTQADEIIVADGGLDAAHHHEVMPSLVVGDMDSASDEAVAWAQAGAVTIERHPADKDHTDGELAMMACLARKPDRIEVYGALGRRTAMLMANLKLLRLPLAQGVETVVVSENERIRLLGAGMSWDLAAYRNAKLSILATEPSRVTLTGTAWHGDFELETHEVRGVSNKVLSYQAKVEVAEGTVLVILER